MAHLCACVCVCVCDVHCCGVVIDDEVAVDSLAAFELQGIAPVQKLLSTSTL